MNNYNAFGVNTNEIDCDYWITKCSLNKRLWNTNINDNKLCDGRFKLTLSFYRWSPGWAALLQDFSVSLPVFGFGDFCGWCIRNFFIVQWMRSISWGIPSVPVCFGFVEWFGIIFTFVVLTFLLLYSRWFFQTMD